MKIFRIPYLEPGWIISDYENHITNLDPDVEQFLNNNCLSNWNFSYGKVGYNVEYYIIFSNERDFTVFTLRYGKW